MNIEQAMKNKQTASDILRRQRDTVRTQHTHLERAKAQFDKAVQELGAAELYAARNFLSKDEIAAILDDQS